MTRQSTSASKIGGPSAWQVTGHALLGTAIGTGAAWVFVPTDTAQLLIASLLPVVAAGAGRRGGRVVGAATATSAALWFGYAHTEPFFHAVIAARADVILTLAVLVVGVLASELADARRKLRDVDRTSFTR